MKNILFILTLGLLIGCAKSNTPSDINNLESLNSLDTCGIVKEDSSYFYQPIYVEELKRSPMDLDTREIRNESEQIRLIENHEKKTQLKVIDRTATKEDANKGWIAYSVAEEMKVQKSYTVKVRISKKNGQSKAELILGNDDAINNPDYPSIAMIEDVKVSGEMSAELRGDSDDFKIVSLSTLTQNIDDESYTEWEWIVTPLKSGENPLKLVVKLKDFNKDIVVFNRSIKVKSNVPVAVEGFFDKYWQWIMTTIIIPIFLYFWNRKKKRKTKKS
jgi:hypothetical protein